MPIASRWSLRQPNSSDWVTTGRFSEIDLPNLQLYFPNISFCTTLCNLGVMLGMKLTFSKHVQIAECMLTIAWRALITKRRSLQLRMQQPWCTRSYIGLGLRELTWQCYAGLSLYCNNKLNSALNAVAVLIGSIPIGVGIYLVSCGRNYAGYFFTTAQWV